MEAEFEDLSRGKTEAEERARAAEARIVELEAELREAVAALEEAQSHSAGKDAKLGSALQEDGPGGATATKSRGFPASNGGFLISEVVGSASGPASNLLFA